MTSAERNKLYRLRHPERVKESARLQRERRKALNPKPEMPASKACRKCVRSQPMSEFYLRRNVTGERAPRGQFGRDPICRSCRSQRNPRCEAKRQEAKALANDGLKKCNVCGEAKPFSAFSTRRASPDGLNYSCRICASARSINWKRSNPEANATWWNANRQRRRDAFRVWREANIDRVRSNYKAWAAANPDIVAANARHRELSKVRATPAWIDKRTMRPLYSEANRLTKLTGIRHEVDHIVPLRNRNVCGLHVPWNLQVITQAMKRRKTNHHGCADSTDPPPNKPHDQPLALMDADSATL